MKGALCLVVVVAACSGRVHHGVDAGPIDASGDTLTAPGGEPSPTATKLTITRHGMPITGVAVIFQAADSSLVTAVLTNELGLAWAEMPPAGGYVTAIENLGADLDELTTFSQVAQGDSLSLELEPTGTISEFYMSLTANADGGASAHQLYTSCGGPFGIDPLVPNDIQLAGCDGTADMLLLSLDSDGQPLRGSYFPAVTLPTGPAPTDATTYPILALNGQYASLTTRTFSYTNVPATIEYISTYHALANARGRTYDQTAGGAPVANAANLSVQMPDIATPTLTVTTTFAPSEPGQQLVYDERSATTAPYALDVASALLPAYTATPTFDVATRTVTWTERVSGVSVDVVRARLHIYRDDIPSGHAWGWRMIAPRTGTTITYPQLPIFGFDFNPTTTDISGIDDLTTASIPGGYNAIRAHGFDDFTNIIMGSGGRLVVQTLTPSML